MKLDRNKTQKVDVQRPAKRSGTLFSVNQTHDGIAASSDVLLLHFIGFRVTGETVFSLGVPTGNMPLL